MKSPDGIHRWLVDHSAQMPSASARSYRTA